ncbi:MAG TPA: hypothetical protein VFY29_17285 [Terriglobia bacterium]|nr:hypothetical protein [Terriglobia bacterium]
MAYVEQGEGLTAGIEERLRQFERKKNDIADLDTWIVNAFTVLKPQILSRHFFNLEAMRRELKSFAEDLDNDARALEAQVKNQPGIVKPEGVADLRSRIDAMKKELPTLLDGNIKRGEYVHKMPDGRTLVRIGPTAPSFKGLPPHPAKFSVVAIVRPGLPDSSSPIYFLPGSGGAGLQIFSVAENGDAVSLVNIMESVGERTNWKDFDIQLSPDWRQIGVYRQDESDVWTSEFWCLAKDDYEGCPGPSNQAPPSPRTLTESGELPLRE